ncbi:MAG: sensor histidine kinase [Lachnospiraceae bacterium]
MDTMFFYILDQLVMIMVYLLIYKGIFDLELRKEKWKYLMCTGGAALLSAADYCLYYYCGIDDIWMKTIIAFICPYLLSIGSRKIRILAFFPAYLIVSFMESVLLVLCAWGFGFSVFQTLENENSLLRFGVDFFTAFIFLIAVKLLQKREKRYRLYSLISLRSYILILLALFCLTMFMSAATLGVFATGSYRADLMKVTAVFSVASVVIVILLIVYMISIVNNQKIQKELMDILEEKNGLQEQYYKVLYEKNDEMRSFRHDYHHHLKQLRQRIMGQEYDEALEYINTLLGTGKNVLSNPHIYSGNQMIDSVIYGVLYSCGEKDISFQYKGKIKRKLYIEDIDLCVVLSNALENAVEACMLCEGKREISMQVAMYQENLQIRISNSYNKTSQKENGCYATEKADKDNHGYGMRNMKKVVEKYDGILESVEKDEKFQLFIQLNEKKEA